MTAEPETVISMDAFTLDELLDSLERNITAKANAGSYHEMDRHARRIKTIRQEIHSRIH